MCSVELSLRIPLQNVLIGASNVRKSDQEWKDKENSILQGVADKATLDQMIYAFAEAKYRNLTDTVSSVPSSGFFVVFLRYSNYLLIAANASV